MSKNSSLHRYSLVLIVAVVASLVLALSWPRLQASLRYLPVDTALSNYWKTRKFDNTQLPALIERAKESITIHDHYRYWEGLSELQILSGQDMNLPAWIRRQALEKSMSAAEEAVKRAPSIPRNWLRIARTGAFLALPAETVLPALKMSILTGRVEPTLMLTRLELGLRYLPELDNEAVRLLRDQAVLIWTIQKGGMVRAIKSGFLSLDQLRELLSNHNQAIILEMEAIFVK